MRQAHPRMAGGKGLFRRRVAAAVIATAASVSWLQMQPASAHFETFACWVTGYGYWLGAEDHVEAEGRCYAHPFQLDMILDLTIVLEGLETGEVPDRTCTQSDTGGMVSVPCFHEGVANPDGHAHSATVTLEVDSQLGGPPDAMCRCTLTLTWPTVPPSDLLP